MECPGRTCTAQWSGRPPHARLRDTRHRPRTLPPENATSDARRRRPPPPARPCYPSRRGQPASYSSFLQDLSDLHLSLQPPRRLPRHPPSCPQPCETAQVFLWCIRRPPSSYSPAVGLHHARQQATGWLGCRKSALLSLLLIAGGCKIHRLVKQSHNAIVKLLPGYFSKFDSSPQPLSCLFLRTHHQQSCQT